ncbi:hypothetical protein [Synechocystis sp. PCC 7509]|uniref:hypothetical protein n=1 Tax=Synechocystis sp. PCC 7509 TaxID=927677 RepID=UPI0002ACAB77|nr:hypothetical protein [Synechocystis sp. PCC 7509]
MQSIIKTFSLSLILSVVTLSPAWAERVLRVSSVAAQDGNVPVTVHIEGGGVLIDFGPTDERITKISIDDPSRIVVDHCLVTKSCNDPPSPVIRLFRSSGINFQDIPAAKVTMLSVETIDVQGNYHSYPFPVTIGIGRSLVSKILIEEDANESPLNTGMVARNRVTPTIIALGVEEAEAKSFLVDPQLKARIRNYLALMESGMSSTKAANRAGISVDLVARLVQLGQAKVWEAESKRPVALRPSSLPLAANPRVTIPPKNTTQNVHQPKLAIAKPTASITPAPVVNSTPPSVPDNNQIQTTRKSKQAIARPTSKTAPVSKPPVTKPAPIVAPLPKPSVTGASKLTYNPAKNHLQANALVRGLIIARRQKSINKTIAAKVQDAIAILRSGKDINTAAKRAGVSIDKINELLTLAGG